MKELNLTDYLIVNENGNVVEEYRICPSCGSKNYPELVREEYFYNCICSNCGHIMFPSIGLYGNTIRHNVKIKFIKQKKIRNI